MTKKTATKKPSTTPRIIPLTFLPPELKALDAGVRVFLFKTEHKGRTLPGIKPGDVLENRRGKRRVDVEKIGRARQVWTLPSAIAKAATPPGRRFLDFMLGLGIDEFDTVRAITVRVQGVQGEV